MLLASVPTPQRAGPHPPLGTLPTCRGPSGSPCPIPRDLRSCFPCTVPGPWVWAPVVLAPGSAGGGCHPQPPACLARPSSRGGCPAVLPGLSLVKSTRRVVAPGISQAQLSFPDLVLTGSGRLPLVACPLPCLGSSPRAWSATCSLCPPSAWAPPGLWLVCLTAVVPPLCPSAAAMLSPPPLEN